MSRPRKIDNERLLSTARKVFLERGVHITTREIAAEIGISEGLIFQRFGSKEGLVRAALSIPPIDAAELVTAAATGQNAREMLENIAVAVFLAFRRVVPPCVPLIAQPEFGVERVWSSRNSPFMMFVVAVERHLADQRHEGRIWTNSPYRTSYFIVSALHNAALLEAINGPSADINEGTIRDWIGIIWEGMKR